MLKKEESTGYYFTPTPKYNYGWVRVGNNAEEVGPFVFKNVQEIVEFAKQSSEMDQDQGTMENTVQQDVNIIVNATNAYPNHRILDLGCSSGGHSIELARRGYGNVVGADIFQYILPIAKKRAVKSRTGVDFVVADWGKLPFKEAFDIAFMFGSGIDLEDELNAFRNISRVLKPGGRFLFQGSNYDEYVEKFQQKAVQVLGKNIYKLVSIEDVGMVINTTTQYLDLNRQIIYTFTYGKGDDVESRVCDAHKFRTIDQYKELMTNVGIDIEDIFSKKRPGSDDSPLIAPSVLMLARKR